MPILEEEDEQSRRRRQALQTVANDTFGGAYTPPSQRPQFGIDRDTATDQMSAALNNPPTVQSPPKLPTGAGGGYQGGTSAGLADIQDPTAAPGDDELSGSMLQRALQMILQQNPVSQEELDRTRALGQSATAQEIGDFQARLAAGGGGATGLGAAVSADLSQRGAMETERAVADAARLGREEQIRTVLAGSQLAGMGSGFETDQVRRGILEEMFADLLAEDQNGSAAPPPSDSDIAMFDTDGDGVLTGDEMNAYAQATVADEDGNSLVNVIEGASRTLNPVTAIGTGMMKDTTREEAAANGYRFVAVVTGPQGEYEIWEDDSTDPPTQYKILRG